MKNMTRSFEERHVEPIWDSVRTARGWHVRWLHHLRHAFMLLLLGLLATSAIAASGLSKVVDGMTIYVGIVPAPIIRGRSMDHASGAMHSGTTRGGQYHLLVVLLDTATGKGIVDAEVVANVSEFGKTGPDVNLDLMKISEAVNYGNYFDLPDSGPFRINLKIRRPNVSQVTQTYFDHTHP